MELFAKKSLGQHFLNSPTVLAKIIEAAAITPSEKVLEIGPGTGVLTRALLDAGAMVTTIEKDDRTAAILESRFANEVTSGALKMVKGDVLTLDRAAIGFKNGDYALVANIPYYITGAILESFLEHEPRPSRMVLLVQREVAERVVARDSKESILSISVKAFGEPKLVNRVPRGAFTPPPSVESAILAINDISASRFTEKGLEISRFFDILKAGFAHKRKFLKRNLEDVLDATKLDEIWQKNGFDQKIRAEDVDLEAWFVIARNS